jgi:two-component system, chemotaxis family, sensor kinase CheA
MLFARLRVGSKLAILAGIPVLGIILLSVLVVRDVQQRAQAAAGLGSLEDLALLSEQMLFVVDELQAERAQVSYDVGQGRPRSPEVEAQEARTDAALAVLHTAFSKRDESKLPQKLQQDLGAARQQLSELPQVRALTQLEKFELLRYLEFFAKANDSLIRAIAALTQLSDDKSLMMSIGGVVSASQIIERKSREHALLNYVLAKQEFPPGSFRQLVTLVSEQEVYAETIRTWSSEEEAARTRVSLDGPRAKEISALRKIAIETTEDAPPVEATVWYDAQKANMAALVQLLHQMSGNVRLVVSGKMAEARGAVRVAMGLVFAVVAASLFVGVVVARGLTRSVRVLSVAADAVHKNNDFTIRAEKTSGDELGRLTDTFNGMLTGIQERERELDGYRKNLEKLVDARTRELTHRNDEMRLVLDNIDQGLATIDREGRLKAECSRSFVEAFGAPMPGTPFFRVLAREDEKLGQALAIAYEQLVADVLPIELALDQMPNHLQVDGRYFSLAFKPIREDQELAGALLVTRDETLAQKTRQLEAEQRERAQIFERILRDPDGFREFVREVQRLIEQVGSSLNDTGVERMRALHTLKGVAGVHDATSLAQAAHHLEAALLGDVPGQVLPALERLAERWQTLGTFVRPLLDGDSTQRVQMTPADLSALIARVREGAPHQSLLRALQRFAWEPLGLRLQRVADQLVGVARRLGKPPPRVVIDSQDLRIPPDAYRAFWSCLSHLVRNIVDHALETEQERLSSGKPAENQVQLKAWADNELLHVQVSDDGRGIDWQRLARRAKERGLPDQTREDLVEALFADGVSTADTVGETSGRGVGMSAVRAVCRELGGGISVQSETGQGTTFRFQLPLQLAGIAPGSGIRPVSHIPASQRGEPERAGSQS